MVKSNAATPVCIALSSRAIPNRPATSQAYASRTTASAIRGTPSMWPELGVSSSATGAPAIWSMLKKCPNLGARANPTVFGKRQSKQFTGIAKRNSPKFYSCYSYEYDDHYFLTDPKEFIYEFFPLQSEWQLLKTTITLKEFEDLPFVRSLFFRYGLYFPDENTKAVMVTDSTGNYYLFFLY